MDELVQIDAQHLQEVLNRLTDRRVAVDKEALILGEPKKGMNDIFRHCRGFERAYSLMLQEANTSFKIRGVVEGLLPDTLRRIPIEKRFNRAYVREICREADGYQPHLVSPERGIRRLVAEAMLLTNDHVHRFVDEVHGVLQDTVREAARRSVLAEAGLGATPGMEFLRLKGFENAVVVAADRALEEWKAEAHKVASTMVAMECDYVTPSFFRELEREWQEAQHGGAGGDGEEGAGERFHAVHVMSPIEIEALLQEDSTVVKRRSAAQTAAKELELAQDEVRRAQERRATGTSPRVEKAAVSARALLLAGAFPLVPANLVPRGTNPAKLYGEHTPMALSPGGTLVMFERRWEGRRGWGPMRGPNSIRLGPPVKVQADGSAANGRGEEAQEAPRASPAPAMEPEAEPAPSSKPPRRQPPPPPPKLAS
ncbi:hypothetical protein APUTEX25_001800 [Auxenochlorella protothecoides]|uniref:Dynamin stalk domain-containing protein n=1 Tax=Auxenochlorella protothecoides TaxID=3075 RepID=A0A3M7L6K7_AUXPR|nr:hypothetical protein APUTEX25_001800 [Auxenochlorella protothecoides]|eukprot:RMZ57600.1 hypothetical protein APUTEX25_001800 [Auxenochlorella protothecoides]